jgi:hypothetical protein
MRFDFHWSSRAVPFCPMSEPDPLFTPTGALLGLTARTHRLAIDDVAGIHPLGECLRAHLYGKGSTRFLRHIRYPCN